MNHYSIIAAILFDEPMSVPMVRDPVEGFTQTFWAAGESFAEVVGYVEAELDGQRVASMECLELPEEDIVRAHLDESVDTNKPGVFHRFDKSFFGPVGSAKPWWQFWK